MRRAAGKVILLGEHAVVYGAPAIAAGIDRGATAHATLVAPGETSRLCLPHETVVADARGADERGRALAALLLEGARLPPLSVEPLSELPLAAGLGSSAAVGVAIARAALAAAGRPEPDDEVMTRATAWERIFHGNPSGIDTAAATLGGCLRFTRKDGPTPLRLARGLVLCIGLSGTSASTRVMVEGLARLRALEPERVDRDIATIAALADDAARAIEAGEPAKLGALMDRNHEVLAGLMLSTGPLDELCAAARGAGALGAKLTGKGGGGAMVALCRSDAGAEPLLEAFRARGYDGFVTRVEAARSRLLDTP